LNEKIPPPQIPPQLAPLAPPRACGTRTLPQATFLATSLLIGNPLMKSNPMVSNAEVDKTIVVANNQTENK